MTETTKIKDRDKDTILRALRAGVVPVRGLQHVQVGRAGEVQALLEDVEGIAGGGAAIRFVIGQFGAGKTFFLHLVRAIALEKKLVCLHADLTPDRRLQGSGGQARALYNELAKNMATRAKPEGGALASVVERFVSGALQEARAAEQDPEEVIHQKLAALSEMVGGYDFAAVVAAYWRGHDQGDEELKSAAVRWLRGEYATKSEARSALGVRTIVDDAAFYDHLKLLARFVRLAGFNGLFVCLDEMVNLYKLTNTKARNSNYEQVLRVLNDVLQGSVEGLGFLMCGTPELLQDPRRGLYSYEALETRLAENRYADAEMVDLSGPVIRLAGLSREDLLVLLGKLRHVYAGGDPTRYLVPDDALTAFMTHCEERIGEAYFQTPRATVREFVNLLAVLEQNPGTDWRALVGRVQLGDEESAGATDDASPGADAGDDELASFQL